MLHSLNAIRVDGYWRLPSTDYSRLFLRHLFASINSLENFQFTNSIPASLILDHFGNQNQIFPFNVVLQLLKIYGGSETPLEQFTLNVEKVCQFYARVILQIETRSKEYIPLTPFMIKWQQALIDDGCEASPTALMLRGIAIVEPAPAALGGGRVYRFESSELPITGDPAPILARLFAARPRWELASMEPYLESVARLLGPKTKAADLIVKHARISVDPNTGLKIVTPLINAL